MTRPETPETPRLEPCSEVNPALWFYFCTLRGREDRPSDVWTEADVVQHLDAAELAKRDNQAWRMFDNILSSSEKSLR
jgi:hypothetical protein